MFSSNFVFAVAVFAAFVLKLVNSDATEPNSSCIPKYVDLIEFDKKTLFRPLGTGFSLLVNALQRSAYARCARTTSRQRLVLLYLASLLLSNSYSPEPNPGPNSSTL